jgi:hypothetical protein
VSAAAVLEGRYRRLLRMYPAGHRRKHLDEMLGVLMTGAHAGQRRPGLADTANLAWGALLIRLRPARPGTAWPLWRDALAVISVLLPLMVLAYSGLLNVATLATLRVGSPIFNAFAGYDAKLLGGWAIVAVLAVLRLRRTAAVAAAALLIWLVYSTADAPNWSYIDAPSMVGLSVAGLEVAALVASPGPRRAMRIINWRHYALALAIPLGLASVFNWVWLADPVVSNSIVITACAVTLAGMTLASPLAKRVAVFLALPVYYLIATFLVPPSMTGGAYESESGWEGPLRVAVTCAPFAVLLCVALVVALRTVRHTPVGSREA